MSDINIDFNVLPSGIEIALREMKQPTRHRDRFYQTLSRWLRYFETVPNEHGRRNKITALSLYLMESSDHEWQVVSDISSSFEIRYQYDAQAYTTKTSRSIDEWNRGANAYPIDCNQSVILREHTPFVAFSSRARLRLVVNFSNKDCIFKDSPTLNMAVRFHRSEGHSYKELPVFG